MSHIYLNIIKYILLVMKSSYRKSVCSPASTEKDPEKLVVMSIANHSNGIDNTTCKIEYLNNVFQIKFNFFFTFIYCYFVLKTLRIKLKKN